MAKTFICNAISDQMFSSLSYTLESIEISEEDFRELLKGEYISAVGHPDTAAVLGVPNNRISVKIEEGDTLVVAQLVGGRLPEGATTLPEGFYFKYSRKRVHYASMEEAFKKKQGIEDLNQKMFLFNKEELENLLWEANYAGYNEDGISDATDMANELNQWWYGEWHA